MGDIWEALKKKDAAAVRTMIAGKKIDINVVGAVSLPSAPCRLA